MSTSLFSNTPVVSVLDNRGLIVRNIAYHRHPCSPQKTDERITRHQYHALGFLMQSVDPRLHGSGGVNFTYATDLTGQVLRTQSADAGITVTLNDAAGRPFISASNIGADESGREDRSQVVNRTFQYEPPSLPGRPLSVTEWVAGGSPLLTERFVYAGNSQAEKALNLAGLCISHYDSAGLAQTDSMALSGVPLSITRRLLKNAGNQETMADWRGEEQPHWDRQLDPIRYTTRTTTNAIGAVLTTTDAAGNRQRANYDVAGQLKSRWLTLNGGLEQVIMRSLTYSASGQTLREEHGNGVIVTYSYAPQTQRLVGLKAERPAGHSLGRKVLQNLSYTYDPVGNILSIRNDAEETRFWRNQQVVPESTYTYDSLYQLVCATGREMANAGNPNGDLPPCSAFDQATYTNYTRTYVYDIGGNLIQMRHRATASNNGYTTDITVSGSSNRAVLSSLAATASQVAPYFTAGGQQRSLLPGQKLFWTTRGELLKVTPVSREAGRSDDEFYRYDANSQRVFKLSTQQAGGRTQCQQVQYLAGLELRVATNGERETEKLQVITVADTGYAQVRVLHWETGKPAEMANNQVRYSYDNSVGSSGLELDHVGNIISQEEYYPYGGTALWAARNQTEASYKTIRYSGKERDATGLYYYGYRYYQPWVGRWLSSDPAGTPDGLNLFCMVQNNPITLTDSEGLAGEKRLLTRRHQAQAAGKKATVAAEVIQSKPLIETTAKSQIVNDFHKGDLMYGISASREPYLKAVEGFHSDNPRDSKDLWFQDNSWARITSGGRSEMSMIINSYNDPIRAKLSLRNAFTLRKMNANKRGDTIRTAIHDAKIGKAKDIGLDYDGYQQIALEHKKLKITPAHVDERLWWKRGSKSGLEMVASQPATSARKIHFILDGMDIDAVTSKASGKHGSSITSSELRYIYRHWDRLVGKVMFYENGQQTNASWSEHSPHKELWNKYRSESKHFR